MERHIKIITCSMFCTYFVIAIVFPAFYINLFLNKALILFDEQTYNNVIPDNIELSTSLVSQDFSKDLLDVYIKESDYFHIYILFEPTYWKNLNTKERKKIKAIISKKWRKIYKKKHENQIILIPKIKIANKD